MDYKFYGSEDEMFEYFNDLGAEDWYHDSDTEDEIPDPNLSPNALYQDIDKPPERLERRYFQEVIIYAPVNGPSCYLRFHGAKTFPSG